MKVVAQPVQTLSRSATAQELRRMRAEGWRILEIDGAEVHGFCDSCGQPCLDADESAKLARDYRRSRAWTESWYGSCPLAILFRKNDSPDRLQ